MKTQSNAAEVDERQRLRTLLATIIPYLPQPVVEPQLDVPQLGQVRGEYWEGSLLFADLSGFTALSESLSLLGTRGAEEITRIVNDLFSALLVDAERYGGVLVKFGGDALTVFFGGDEHASRAVLAASMLQEVMKERFINLDTLGGFFTLRLRVGVHAGRIFAAHVGYEPGYPLRGMELVVTGADVNRVAEAQDYAAPGDVCITADVLARIPTYVEVEPVAGAMYRLLQFDASGWAKKTPPAPAVIDLSDWPARRMRLLLDALGPYLPVDFTDERNTDPSDPELRPGLRPVAVLFANFLGYSAILGALADKGEAGVHMATAILNTYYVRMQDVIGRYGGVVNKVDMHTRGDKLMALFGAPRAHGDDVERAVRAALEMQDVLGEVNQHIREMLELIGAPVADLTQRIGINHGHVFAGNVGSERAGSRREYTVMGDAVNLAARLMSAAAEGEILISPSVRRQVSERFEIVDLSPIQVKGKTEPVPVSRPVRPLSSRERVAIRRGHRPFIGRESQLEALKLAVRGTLTGQAQVAVIVGEVGAGKSRLIEEFQGRLVASPDSSGVRCTVTELPSYAQEPYAPFIDLLRRLIGLGGRPADDVSRLSAWVEKRVSDLGHFLPLMGDLLALPIDDNQVTAALTREQRRDRLFDMVEAALHSEARVRPLVFVVDDLQWADAASLALLQRLAQDIADSPLLLVLCYRSGASFSTPWMQLPHTVVVNVEEFVPEESADMISKLLDADELPENLAELVWGRAQGNPFFTEEFVKSLREMGAIIYVDGQWQLVSEGTAMTAIPDTIEGIVLARLDRLEVRCREVLQEVSVAATSQVRIAGALVERVDPFPAELPQRLDSLVNDGLLETLESELEELAYHFRHTLTRDVAYDNLLHARRRELHGLFARAIEALYVDRLDEQVTTLAHHYVEAEDWPQAFSYLRRAGVRAQLLFANRDAISNYEEAFLTAEPFSARTAFVGGYDFLIDSAASISSTLGLGGLGVTSLVNDTWNKNALLNNWLGTRQDLGSVNAHFDHWQAIPADESGGTLLSGEVGGAANMLGTVNFSMGCHSGFSVHNAHGGSGRELDFPQALAQQGAWWIGNTGYGYGMDDSIAYTERVMDLFAQRLISGPAIPVGEALRWAKNQYLGTVPSGGFGTYDEKAMIEANLYGLPMYSVTVPRPGGPVINNAPLSVNALVTESVVFELAGAFQLETGALDGDYYAIAGEVQAGPGRPVQPRTGQPVPIKPGQTAHGAVLVGALTDHSAGFNPLISRPVTDTKLSEPVFDAPAWFPSKPWSVNRLAEEAQLVVVPAQFQGDQDSGNLRRFTQLTFEVYYTDTVSADFSSPAIWLVGSQTYGDVGDFWVIAEDTSGIQRVTMAYSRDGVHWQTRDFVPSPSQEDRWETRVTALGDSFVYFIQVVDGAGNVTVSSNKGLYFTPPRNLYLPGAASMH